MRRTNEQHLANIRASVAGMTTAETRDRIRNAKVAATMQAYRAAGKQPPEVIVVMPEYVDGVMAAEDDLIRKVIAIIGAVDAYEAVGERFDLDEHGHAAGGQNVKPGATSAAEQPDPGDGDML